MAVLMSETFALSLISTETGRPRARGKGFPAGETLTETIAGVQGEVTGDDDTTT